MATFSLSSTSSVFPTTFALLLNTLLTAWISQGSWIAETPGLKYLRSILKTFCPISPSQGMSWCLQEGFGCDERNICQLVQYCGCWRDKCGCCSQRCYQKWTFLHPWDGGAVHQKQYIQVTGKWEQVTMHITHILSHWPIRSLKKSGNSTSVA